MPAHRRSFTASTSRIALAGSLAALIGACSSVPPAEPAAPPPPPAPITLQQYMEDAGKAYAEGALDKERALYRKAAEAYPAAKDPWVRLAVSYFQNKDYGNAITASHEALQRDAADPGANSIAAVSGLRVSAASLSTLRQQGGLNGDTRTQAEAVAKSLRETLGEPVLVPKEVAPAAAPRRAGRPRAAPATATGVTPGGTTSGAGAARTGTGSNPFGKLAQ